MRTRRNLDGFQIRRTISQRYVDRNIPEHGPEQAVPQVPKPPPHDFGQLAMFRTGPRLAQANRVTGWQIDRQGRARRGSQRHSTELAGSHVDARSSMLAPIVKSGGSKDVPATPPAAPSSAGPTRTSEPLPAVEPGPHPIAPTQLRDPERYQIMGEHGRGGLGRVSRAHDRELGRDVAIKELLSRGHLGEVRFLREALITARLEHPGIVPVHEAGRWPDGTPFYAMKLVSGRSLRELIAERTTVEQRIGLLHHVIAVADAIAYAHDRNIIHRDLKPANVIVGDFGETIVIDWGLAKDLTTTEDSGIGGGPFRTTRDDDLTSAGSILGTPAYMAPEQERGEHVDQRADVFAIGTMLWELCALQKLPHREPQLRHRMLRRAGIDKDLATIIDKALDPDPERRYPDAGALAADLKAFKSGARIAARSYSLFAMLAHWTRRHRTLALSVSAAIALAVAGSAFYLRNITAERDRADAAFGRVEAANNNLTLEHAELLLHSDPTAAVAALSGYGGDDALRRRRLLAEAQGRGVATSILTPHSDTIWFLFGDNTGAIVSVGEDRLIRITQGRTSTTLVTDVSAGVQVRFEPAKRLLAYATTPPGIAILDLNTRTAKRISTINPFALEFSPDGSRLAVLDKRGELVVWSLAPEPKEIYRELLPGASRLRFATPTRIIVQDGVALHAVALDLTEGIPATSMLSNVTSFDAQPEAVVVGFDDGHIAVLSTRLDSLSTISVCRKRLSAVRFIPHIDRFAYSCQDGTAGIVRYSASLTSLTNIDTFATRGSTVVRPDFGGRYIIITDQSNTAYIYDTQTRLMNRYQGNAGQPTYVAAPTSEFGHVLIGDANGTVRVWDPPSSAAQVLLQAPSSIFGLAFSPDNKSVIVNGADRVARYINIDTQSTIELRGHTAGVLAARVSPDQSSLLTYSYDGTVRVWRTGDFTLSRVLSDHASLVEEADYIEYGRRIVSVGDDGRLLAWSPDGADVSVLFEHSSPLTGLEVLKRNSHIVVKDATGSIWDVSPDRAARRVRNGDGATVTALRASADGNFVATGTDTGVVIVYETSNWHAIKTILTKGSIRQIEFDPMNRDLLIASEAGRTQFGHVQFAPLSGQRTPPWHEVIAAVRRIAYAPDGETIGYVCADGGTWLYSVRNDIWVYSQEHDADTLTGVFSPDGSLFASTDRQGVVVVRDVTSMFASATRVRL
jgi:serine/threonine protein kinase/WD40 repeat protein